MTTGESFGSTLTIIITGFTTQSKTITQLTGFPFLSQDRFGNGIPTTSQLRVRLSPHEDIGLTGFRSMIWALAKKISNLIESFTVIIVIACRQELLT